MIQSGKDARNKKESRRIHTMSIARVNNNVMAMGAYRNLSVVQSSLNNNVRHFSTGLRIESAKDDATGLAISERFRTQITGYETANKNAADANNLLQVADGALNESHTITQRLRQLALTAANEATTDADRSNMQTEVNQLLDELDNIARTTQYNGRNLMDGTLQGSKSAKDAAATVTQNSYVNLSSVQGTMSDVTNKLVSTATASVAYSGQDITFEIRCVGSVDAAGVATTWAQVYMSGSLNTNGSYKVIASVNLSAAGLSSLYIDIPGCPAGSPITIGLNQSATTDIGKTAFVRVTNAQAAITTDKSVSFQVRANQGQTMGVSMDDMSTAGLRIQKLNLTDRLSGQNALIRMDDAIQRISTQRANIGALQQRLSSTISANELNIINQRAAESRIRDVDFADETLSFTRNNILIQSGTAVLAQANAAPQSVLSLLKG